MVQLLVTIDSDLDTEDDLAEYASWITRAMEPFSIEVKAVVGAEVDVFVSSTLRVIRPETD